MRDIEPPDPHDENDPSSQNEPRDEDEQQDQEPDEQHEHHDRDAPDESDDQRPGSLTLEEEERILDAVARGMCMRAVTDDPNIRGTYEQVRRVVRRARQNDPRFGERTLKRSRKPAPADQIIAVLESDAASAELTPPAVFVDAGVPRDAVRFCKFPASPTRTIHLFRTPDGTVIPVLVESRERRPLRARGGGTATRRRDARRRRRLLVAAAAALLLVLVALWVASPWKSRTAGLAVQPAGIERVNGG